MNSENQSVSDDLAFLRALAEGGGESQHTTGAGLVAGGVLYGAQCLAYAAQGYGFLDLNEVQSTVFSAAVTIVFLAALAWIIWQGRRAPMTGVTARALVAAFASAGTATLAMLCVFANVALREESLTIWQLYPCAVFALQGAAWMVAWMLRRRVWLGAVALGWMLSSVALSWTIGTQAFALVAGLSLLLLMALPGAVLMRAARR